MKMFHKKITASSLRDIVEGKYPFNYPLATYECIIEKLESNGLLAPIKYDGVVYFEPKKGFQPNDIEAKRIEFQRAIDLTTNEFCIFSQNYNKNFSLTTAKSLLIDFLKDHLEQLLKPNPTTDLSSIEKMTDEESIVCLFIIEHYENSTEINNHLKTIIKGIICYTYIYYKNESCISSDLSSVKVFLDTPLIIFALGYSGTLRQQLAREFILQLKSLKAEVYCFEHSLREIRDSLSACEHIINKREPGIGAIRYTVEYFLSQKEPLTKINLAAKNLTEDIEKKAEIKIFSNSLYQEANRKPFIDEKALASKLAEKMVVSEQDYERVEADAKSINLTTYLRDNDKNITELSNAKAIFVTKNKSVVKVSSEFLGERPYEVPTTYHYATLSALLLFSNEIPEPNLPLTIIIENCYAVVAPKDALWSKYIEKLNAKFDSGELSDVDYLKFRSMKFSRGPLLAHSLEHLPYTSISLEEVQRIDEERIMSEAKKVRDEERSRADAAISDAIIEKDRAIGEKNNAIGEKDNIRDGVSKLKNEKKCAIKSTFERIRWIFCVLTIIFIITSVFTSLPLYFSIPAAIISAIASIATFLPNKLFGLETYFLNRAEKKIDKHFDIK